MTSDGSAADRNTSFGASLTVSSLMVAVADEAGCSPFEFPPLNEIADPDALSRLFDAPTLARTERAPTGIVCLDVGTHLVTVRNDGSVSVTDRDVGGVDEALGVVDEATAHEGAYDWTDTRSLSTTVVETVADGTDAEPAAVRDAIEGVLDPSALDALFRPRITGTARGDGGIRVPFREYDVVIKSDGNVSLQPTLARIKRTGGNLLVVGSVPREVSDEMSRTLLGSDPDRVRIVALDGRRVETAFDRLSRVNADSSRTVIVDHGNGGRSAAAATPIERPIPVVDVADGIDEITSVLTDQIDSFADDCGDFSAGQLRFCLDSLGSLRSRHGDEETEAFLEAVCDRVTRASGIGHYVLLADRDSSAVRAVEDRFDVVVELRVAAGGAEQRWHLLETGHTTEWFYVRNPLAG